MGLSHTTSTFTGQPTADRIDATLNTRVSRDLGLTFTAERDRGGSLLGFGGVVPGNRLSAGVTAAFSVGRNTNVFAQATNAGGATASSVTVSKSAPNGPGFGYIVRGAAAGAGSADLNYQTQYGDLSLLTNSEPGNASATLTLAGSVVAFKQGVFLTRPISNAYALAQIPGFDKLPVFLGSQYQGHTDGRGAMVVSALSAYSDNQLGVDEMKDRFDIVQDQPVRSVRPRLYSGVATVFDVHVLRAYSGTVVVRRDGHDVVPAYAQLTLARTGPALTSELGSDGQFYLDDIAPGEYVATLTGTGVACTFSMRIPAGDGPVTKLGVLTCEAAP
jgi:outer membrane usher protein